MELHEGLAAQYERTSPRLRHHFALAYRSAVGVYPEQRQEFRATLEQLREVGGTPVDDVASLMRLQYELDQFLTCDHENRFPVDAGFSASPACSLRALADEKGDGTQAGGGSAGTAGCGAG